MELTGLQERHLGRPFLQLEASRMLFPAAALRQTGVTMRTLWTVGRLEECAQALKRRFMIQCQKRLVAFRKYNQAPLSAMTGTFPEVVKKRQKAESCLEWKNLSMLQMMQKRGGPEGIHPTEDGGRVAVVKVDGAQQKLQKGRGTSRTWGLLQVRLLLGSDANILFWTCFGCSMKVGGCCIVILVGSYMERCPAFVTVQRQHPDHL
mmetsp:Transcript_3696/g.23173  ORF Transcript_3696/g.23173 Transcript_3696/m.23173 type:complete len:206 (-) Transcript_3696:179-796(-)